MPGGAGAKDGFFCKLVDVVVDNFGGFYPELRAQRDRVRAPPHPLQSTTVMQAGIYLGHEPARGGLQPLLKLPSPSSWLARDAGWGDSPATVAPGIRRCAVTLA